MMQMEFIQGMSPVAYLIKEIDWRLAIVSLFLTQV